MHSQTNICIQLQRLREAPGSLWNPQGISWSISSRLRTSGYSNGKCLTPLQSLPLATSVPLPPVPSVQFSSVQSLSCVQLFVTPWIAARQASLSITNSQSSLRLTSIESVIPSSHLILCRPLLLLPPIPPSIRVFSNESTLCMGGQSTGVSASASFPPNQIPGLISFRMDWLDLLAVQGTLKSLLHYHSSKASILWCSAFFTVQLSHPYMTIGKTITLTRRTFVGKVMSLLLNMLSRLVITLPSDPLKDLLTTSFSNRNHVIHRISARGTIIYMHIC